MENDIIVQMEKLQLLAFFSGYALLFILISQMADWFKNKPTFLFIRLFTMLSWVYSLGGLC